MAFPGSTFKRVTPFVVFTSLTIFSIIWTFFYWNTFVENKKKCLNGKIIHKENLGSDVYLHVVLNENEEKIIVRSDSTNAFEVKIGEELNTEWNDEKILTFDLDGKSLPLNK